MTIDSRNSISIPSTEIELTLNSLISISLRKNFHPLTFNKLFKEFKHRVISINPSDTEIDLLPLFSGCSNHPLQLKYIFEVLVQNDLNNNFDDLARLFSEYMSNLSRNDQTIIIIFFNQMRDEFPWSKLVENDQFLTGFCNYLRYIEGSDTSSYEDDSKMILMVSKFIINLLKGSSKIDRQLNDAVKEYLDFLRRSGFEPSYDYLHSFYSNYSHSTIKKGYQVSGFTTSKDHLNPKINSKVLKLKKIVWLSQHVTIEFTSINENFIKSFKSLLNLSSVATSATNTSITYELLTSVFDCLSLSTSKTRHLWIHFILIKLPQLLKTLNINQLKLGNSLMTVFESIDFDKYKEILIKLLRNLAEMDLIKTQDFSKLFPDIAVITPPSPKMSKDEFLSAYDQKFHQMNPEFVSIEEAEIHSFINQINEALSLKSVLSEQVNSSISNFIKENDSLRLRRLLISLTLNEEILEYVLLNESPYEFILPLVAYLNKNLNELPEARNSKQEAQDDEMMEDLDMSGGESTNVQDFYTDFGSILIFLKLITMKFNLNLLQVPGNYASLQLINNWDSTKNDTYLTNVQEQGSQLNNMIDEWILSLFDSSNTDGLSDDLIKACSINDYYYMLPDILKEAVISCSLHLIDDDSLLSGLEYFHQPFLISNMASILKSLLCFTWANNKEADIAILVKVLNQLCHADLSGEVQILHTLIMKIMNEDLTKALTPYKDNTDVASFLSKLEPLDSNVSNGTDLNNLITYVIDPTFQEAKFELSMIFKIADSYSSNVDWFYNKLLFLLESEHTKQADLAEILSYEVISLLIVNYASSKPTSNLKYWRSVLNAASEKSEGSVIYNRKGVDDLEIDSGVKDSSDGDDSMNGKDENKFGADMTFDSNFFGFIEEPKDYDSDQQTEVKLENSTVEEDVTQVELGDSFVSNILVLLQSKNDDVVKHLVSKIDGNLTELQVGL